MFEIKLVRWKYSTFIHDGKETKIYVPKIKLYNIILDKNNQFKAERFEREVEKSLPKEVINYKLTCSFREDGRLQFTRETFSYEGIRNSFLHESRFDEDSNIHYTGCYRGLNTTLFHYSEYDGKIHYSNE